MSLAIVNRMHRGCNRGAAGQRHAGGGPAADRMKKKLVVIGNGMAPGRALEKLFEAAPDAYEVTIFNAEPRVNYDRIMLSPLLSGEKSFEQIVIHGDGWYVKHGVTLYKGATVTSIDRAAKTVTSARGVTVPYDKLLIATGSLPIIIPVPGHKLAGVLTYRDLDDVQAMLLAAKSRGSAVVIGGGLLGLEAAAGLKEQGMDVTVLHLMPTLDGAPARSDGRAPAAEGRRGARHPRHHQGQHQGDPGREEGRGGAARGRHAVARGPRHHGRRHQAERGACQGGGDRDGARHQSRCDDAHQRSRNFRGRRVRRSGGAGVRSRGAALRNGERHRRAARRRRERKLHARARSRPN